MDDISKKPVEIRPTLRRPESGRQPESGLELEPTAEGAAAESEPAEESADESVGQLPAVQTVAPAVIPAADRSRDMLLIEVEEKLEDNLWDAYRAMTPDLRLKFKMEGERIAQVVREGIATGRVVAHNILTMIVEWLGMIPGVNRWFLIQEAKIKTDALIKLGRNRSHQE
ncbi:hypothetical protein COY93_04395 [Candidatus Uhrbacteria bacterium CG_4_10_14_0_8_um_filter_58_22]|uniref:Uncharacterized protein n=1 Tax=Candidatus Uhrbacteria bacterium CG_4_10_14_0_8_um_filter_58_22 TaxID=1975029 RepID=A0A2M7Q925_9BACT|nr:MAG: hypothetical protein AUJ19_02255 [Parcubacteria group bacterium CG1_02_58_44]PIY61955.1 MAG: hypothetical protein COY93_04395 [Candidatus Uhrbacteria bacterium CG_4_10_14_0_8_um_filter_58_22]